MVGSDRNGNAPNVTYVRYVDRANHVFNYE
jgi:hypothetical protein